ncbi:hypothetical protein MBLNU230_g7867t1 [Neophaeotheca triangularis]
MPYTPPSQQSPASSKSASPTVSRSGSISEDGPRSPVTGRPQLPRSHSSTSYLHKHRRSPSFASSKEDGAPTSPTETKNIKATDFACNGSVRQSPPPRNNLLIPTGAVISPPDSSPEGSDGDDRSQADRGRDLRKTWNELHEAVRSIDLRRDNSPVKEQDNAAKSEPVSQTTSPTALSREARKISHSRSSTETAIMIPRTTSFTDSPTATSDDSEGGEDPLSKPSLVRKKSGELVKPALRPSSRRRYSSMPGTPTYSKSVHFNDNGNQTRHFLQVDKPMAVSAGSSPNEAYETETEYPFGQAVAPKAEWDIKLANFPEDSFERKTKPVRVERMYLSADKQVLIGTCAVQNLSFHKLVVARFTLDYWKTTSEVVADYHNDLRHPSSDGCDRFTFSIKLSDQANIENKTLLLCVRYNVGGQEFWDNNDNTNYQVDFVKNVSQPSAHFASGGLGARPLNAIPRSRHSPLTTTRGAADSLDDDFASRFNSNSAYSFGSVDNFLGESASSVKLKPRAKRGSVFPTGSAQQANGLGGRYDFGASLSAALSNAQDKIGRNDPGNGAVAAKLDTGYFTVDHKEASSQPLEPPQRPDSLTTDRPAMGSDQYKDLVQKFCYFTPGTGKGVSMPPRSASGTPPHVPARQTDGSCDKPTSGTSSPAIVLDEGNERTTLLEQGSYFPRHDSPASSKRRDSFEHSTTTPLRYGYLYGKRDGYLAEAHTPTAIYG